MSAEHNRERMRKWRRDHPQEAKERNRLYYEKNKERLREYNREWRRRKKAGLPTRQKPLLTEEEYRRKQKEYKRAHRKEQNAYQRKWYEANREKSNESNKAWRHRNKDVVQRYNRDYLGKIYRDPILYAEYRSNIRMKHAMKRLLAGKGYSPMPTHRIPDYATKVDGYIDYESSFLVENLTLSELDFAKRHHPKKHGNGE